MDSMKNKYNLNTATSYNGGDFGLLKATLTVNGYTCTSNTATAGGPNVYLSTSTMFYMHVASTSISGGVLMDPNSLSLEK